MCMANVIVAEGKANLIEKEGEKIVADKISRVKVRKNDLELDTFYEGKKSVEAKIKAVDFANSKILLEK